MGTWKFAVAMAVGAPSGPPTVARTLLSSYFQVDACVLLAWVAGTFLLDFLEHAFLLDVCVGCTPTHAKAPCILLRGYDEVRVLMDWIV